MKNDKLPGNIFEWRSRKTRKIRARIISIPRKKLQQINVNFTRASPRNRSGLIKSALKLKCYIHAFSLLSPAQFAARSCGDAKQVCNFK